jgi:hypothetical protein
MPRALLVRLKKHHRLACHMPELGPSGTRKKVERCRPVCSDLAACRTRHSTGFLWRAALLLGLLAPAALDGTTDGGCTTGCRLTLTLQSAAMPALLSAPLLGCPVPLRLVSDPDTVLAPYSGETSTPLLLLLRRQNNASRPLHAPTASAVPSGLNARLVTRWPKAHA